LFGHRPTVLLGNTLRHLDSLFAALLSIGGRTLLPRDPATSTSVVSASVAALAKDALDEVLLEVDQRSDRSLTPVMTMTTISSSTASVADGLVHGLAVLLRHFVALLLIAGLVAGLVGGAALLLVAGAALLRRHTAALLLVNSGTLLFVLGVLNCSALLFVDSAALLFVDG